MESNSQKYHGEWWIPAESNNDNRSIFPIPKGMEKRCVGTLTYREKGNATLELYHIPSDYNSRLYKYNGVMWGRDANGHIFTLFNVEMSSFQLSDFTNTTFVVGYILLGEHVLSMDDACFNRCIVQFPHLRNWAFYNNLSLKIKDEAYLYTLKKNDKGDYLIEQEVEEGVKWILRDSYSQHLERFSMTITQTTEFVVEVLQSVSIHYFLRQITEFSQFLSIALYGKQAPSSIQLMNKGNKGLATLLFTKKESVEPQNLKNLIKFDELKDKIPSMLSVWHQNFEKVSPISKYLVDSLCGSKTFDVPDFLIIAQALDGYHKRFVNKKNGKDNRKYEEQIDILLKQFEDVEAIQMSNLNPVVVKDSRHKYSHLYPDDEKPDAVDGIELYWLTEKCKILLICCMLNMLGLTNDEINICCKHSPIDYMIKSNPFEFEAQ